MATPMRFTLRASFEVLERRELMTIDTAIAPRSTSFLASAAEIADGSFVGTQSTPGFSGLPAPVGAGVVNHAPAGTNGTVTTSEDTAYTLKASDFGFSDPNDSVTILPGATSKTAANVLVLYNVNSSDGTAIANYYAQVHPGVSLRGISGVDPNSEDITADQYLATIRPQVLSALTPSIDIIVTTKGLPLRINVTETALPIFSNYVDANGTTRLVAGWERFSSLESELARVDTISSWQMMGDQSYIFSGHFAENPYYKVNTGFSHATYNTRLTARLDGYTVADVTASIDRAQNAFVNGPNGSFYLLVDNTPAIGYAPTMAALVNNVLTPGGHPVVYDNTTAFVGTAPGSVIGYDSHGVHQASTPANYILNGLNLTLADGAVFNSWESFNAYTFNPVSNPHGNQGQVGQWLQIGGTAGVGNVEEPGASSTSVINEDQMFKMLFAGYSFAESAWSAARQLSFVNTVVGDPLMTWRTQVIGTPNSLQAVKITTLATAGTLTNGGVAVVAGQFISVADINAGKLKFTPAANTSGTGYASFTFQVQDNGGTTGGGVNLDPTANTITINVTPVNDPPGGANKTVTTFKNTAYAILATDFGFADTNDSPANALLGVKISTLPAAGQLTDGGVPVAAGQIVSATDLTGGLLKFTPATNATGTTYASFNFQVQDNGGATGVNLDPTANTITISVTVSPHENFVRGLYKDVLGRSADPGGFTAWVNALNNGLSTSSAVAGFWNSIEHRGMQVDGYYQTLLHRSADPGGRQFWVNNMLAGTTEEALVAMMVNSGEYKNRNTLNKSFVDGLFRDLLGHAPDTATQTSLVNALASQAKTPTQVGELIVDSHERHLKLIDSYYLKFLGRKADPSGSNAWTSALDQHIVDAQSAAVAFLSSLEYYKRPH